jgi:hypothetical protein
MHFSYMLQKYANIPTYVPPHPRNNKELWGSTKEQNMVAIKIHYGKQIKKALMALRLNN